MSIKSIICTITAVLISFTAYAQSNIPKNEVRGAWIATVTNLDWPASGNTSVSEQQEDLIFQLDELKEAGINLVFFQVRTEGDALYDSDIEPWSAYLTGEEGTPPDPYWDPLEFAIEEAHKRGMELHAWLNPYRAMRVIPGDFTQKQTSPHVEQQVDESLEPFLNKEYDANAPKWKLDTDERDSMHVSNTHTEWLLVLNNAIAIFDPGLPEVMDYNLEVLMDIVNRYDIDGIHFDDYFYPYPPNHMASSPDNNALDDETFENHSRGFTDKEEWRRDNINLFVQMVHDSIQVEKPWVKFGISPFGIWRSGTPPGISGMDAYATIYADGLAWLEDQTIDYITPQLYWPFGGGQDYGALAPWWAEETAENDRHIYPGHGLYRTDGATFANNLFNADEIPRQIRHNRNNDNIDGSVFFRSKNITHYSSKGFADSLKNNYYRYAALPPTMPWKDTTKPNTPQNLTVERDTETEFIFHLNWNVPADLPAKSISSHGDSLIKYAIYRVDSEVSPNETEEMQVAEHLIAVTGETTFTDIAPPSANEYYYFVTAVTRNNVESDPVESELGGLVTAGNIDISPHAATIDTSMTLKPALTVTNVDDEVEFVSRKKISWSLTDTDIGEIDENGVFTPHGPGETAIVADLNIVSDTLWVEVTHHEGYADLNNFTDTEEWEIETNNLDQELVDVIALDDNQGIEINYTLPANTSGAEIIISNDIILEGVPGFANVKASSDTSAYGMSLFITNPEEEVFQMDINSFDNLSRPDVLHFEFSESKTTQITSGAEFYYPFNLESILVELPDNNSENEAEGYFRLHEFGVSYTDNPVSNEEEISSNRPDRISLEQNYPNPFNPTTNITFNLPSAERINLSVFDILGRKVQTLIDGRLQSGSHSINFDASGLSSGIYIYQLKTGDISLTQKMTLIK